MKKLLSQLDELNVTGDAGGSYNTPKFTGEIDPDAIDDEYEVVDDEEDEEEMSTFKKYAYEVHGLKEESLNEQQYKEYVKDNSITNKRKLNKSISNLNGQLQIIERILDQNIKLKKEKKLSNRDVWNTTKKSLNKTNQRIARIQTKIMQLMS